NGGVTKDAITSARIVRPSGTSVRATTQPIGAATAQQIAEDDTATMRVVISGSRKSGSENRRSKFSKVKAPPRSLKPKTSSHDTGSTMSTQSSAAEPQRIGRDRSRIGRRAARPATAMLTAALPRRGAASHFEDACVARFDLVALFLDGDRIVFHLLDLGERLAPGLFLDLRMDRAQAAEIDVDLLRLGREHVALEEARGVGIGRRLQDRVGADDQRA